MSKNPCGSDASPSSAGRGSAPGTTEGSTPASTAVGDGWIIQEGRIIQEDPAIQDDKADEPQEHQADELPPPPPILEGRYIWQYQERSWTSKVGWIDMTPEVSQTIDDAFRAGEESVEYWVNGRKYKADLIKRIQTVLQPQRDFETPIRRGWYGR